VSEPILIKEPSYIIDSRGIRRGRSFNLTENGITFKNLNKSGYVINAKGKIVSIGFYNCHCHVPMIFLAGIASNLGFWSWLHRIINVEAKLIEKSILNDKVTYYASLIFISLHIRNGCCGIVDMYFNWTATVQACKKLGVRILSGPVNPISWNHFKAEVNRVDYELFKPIINMHSLYGVKPEIMKDVVNEIRNHIPWIKLHIHVSETRDEVYKIWLKYRRLPIQLLDEYNLTNNALLVHLCWITYSEIELLRHRKCFIAHCPTSNALLYTGSVAPVAELDKVGVKVTLGTDGFNPSYEVNLRRVAKDSVLQLRQQYWSAEVTAWDVYRFLAVNGAKLFNVDNIIDEGTSPDIVILNVANEIKSIVNENNLMEFIIYAPELTPIDTVIVSKKVIYSKRFNIGIEKELERASVEILRARSRLLEIVRQ